ncbi:unnamed protein product [Amaranthus hypochondriacus]
MATTGGAPQTDKKRRSIFEVPANFFDSCCLLPPSNLLQYQLPSPFSAISFVEDEETLTSHHRDDEDKEMNSSANFITSTSNHSMNRLSCNTCKSEFCSLLDQRSHFKSDLHRFNVKLSLAGKDIIKEDDFDELTSDSFSKDFDVSSISGSEDEDERGPRAWNSTNEMLIQTIKQKVHIRLLSGEKISVWKCMLLKDSENVCYDNNQIVVNDDYGHLYSLKEADLIQKLKALTREPSDKNHFRIVLLASGGHFAGCVFDGNNVVAHKTFHRYVVRAKAGKRQSSKDASGKSIHSAGASLRRYNELALKKDIYELLASWKPYFDASSCVFIYAPSNNRQLFFNGETSLFSNQHCDARNIPFSVRRPTLKEARRVFNQLSQVTYETEEEEVLYIKQTQLDVPDIKQIQLSESCISDANLRKDDKIDEVRVSKGDESFASGNLSDKHSSSDEGDKEVRNTTPLHEAARSDSCEKVLELLEQGLDPTIKDERGKTPYMLATEKEVRNTFRRFMAANLDKWDWHAAKVPSALTTEMEESQAFKQAEKDAKRKAKAKELKKLRKAREREKKAQVNTSSVANSAVNL